MPKQTHTPNETALRLIATELKAVRTELRATRTTLHGVNAKVDDFGSHLKGIQVALGERERDFLAKHEQIGQRTQSLHERIDTIDKRVVRVERAIKPRPA